MAVGSMLVSSRDDSGVANSGDNHRTPRIPRAPRDNEIMFAVARSISAPHASIRQHRINDMSCGGRSAMMSCGGDAPSLVPRGNKSSGRSVIVTASPTLVGADSPLPASAMIAQQMRRAVLCLRENLDQALVLDVQQSDLPEYRGQTSLTFCQGSHAAACSTANLLEPNWRQTARWPHGDPPMT